jgi:hypothetical protein
MEKIVYFNFMDCIAYCISGENMDWIELYGENIFPIY